MIWDIILWNRGELIGGWLFTTYHLRVSRLANFFMRLKTRLYHALIELTQATGEAGDLEHCLDSLINITLCCTVDFRTSITVQCYENWAFGRFKRVNTGCTLLWQNTLFFNAIWYRTGFRITEQIQRVGGVWWHGTAVHRMMVSVIN